MQMRREPPVRLECMEETCHRRGAEDAFVDVLSEERFSPEEAADVAVVFYALGPIVGEEDGWAGELEKERRYFEFVWKGVGVWIWDLRGIGGGC